MKENFSRKNALFVCKEIGLRAKMNHFWTTYPPSLVKDQGRHGWQGPQGLLSRFWISIRSYKKQLVKKIWGRILGLVWLKFAVVPLKVICERPPK